MCCDWKLYLVKLISFQMPISMSPSPCFKLNCQRSKIFESLVLQQKHHEIKEREKWKACTWTRRCAGSWIIPSLYRKIVRLTELGLCNVWRSVFCFHSARRKEHIVEGPVKPSRKWPCSTAPDISPSSLTSCISTSFKCTLVRFDKPAACDAAAQLLWAQASAKQITASKILLDGIYGKSYSGSSILYINTNSKNLL